MTGLDFEELDKAVKAAMDKSKPSSPAASLSNNMPESNAASNQINKKVDKQPSSSSTPRRVLQDIVPGTLSQSSDQPISVLEESMTTTTESEPSKSPRAPFMDIKPPISPRANRLGNHATPAIAPLHDNIEKEHSMRDVSIETSAQTLAYEDEEYPDIDEVAAIIVPEEHSLVEEKTSVDHLQDEIMEEASQVEDKLSEPMTSPFIANPQIEKRPLGPPKSAIPEVKQDSKVLSNDTFELDDLPVKQAAENKIEAEKMAVTVPAELQGELLEIETEKFEDRSDAQPSAAPIENARQTHEPAKPSVAVNSLPPRQNKTNHDQDSKTAHEQIYATAAYPHQVQANSRLHSWLVPVIIIAFLVAGAVGGVLFYLMNTQS